MKPAIVHVITELGAGGAERMLLRLVTASTRYRHVVVSLSRDGTLVPALRDAGADVVSLGMRRYLPSLRGIFGLAKIIRRERPIVIQTWLYHADLIGLIAAKLTGYPIAWNLRCSNMDLSQYRWSTRIVVRFLVWLSSLPNLVMANSESGRRWHLHLGYRAQQWALVPNGIDTAIFCPNVDARTRWRQRLGIKDGVTLVGMVARRDPMKDHEGMLRAAAEAARHLPNLEFVLAGRGITQNDQALARLANVVSAPVHLIGECDDPAGLNAALDMAVLSSAYGEGFPNVLAEAMATGVPCIATDVGDSKLIIDKTGLVVPPRNPQALAEVIVNLAEDQALRLRLGKAARDRMEQHYGLAAAIARYEAIWERIATAAERAGNDRKNRRTQDERRQDFDGGKPALAAAQANTSRDAAWNVAAYERMTEPGPLNTPMSAPADDGLALPEKSPRRPTQLSEKPTLFKIAQHGLPILVTVSALAVAFSRFDLGKLWKTAASLQISTLAIVLIALTLGNLLACIRLQLLARDLHHPVRFRDAFAATALGQLAGSFFFQIIGQTLARSAVFSKVGVSMPTTIIITGYERVVAAAISLALALIGTFYLFGHITLDLAGGGDEFLKILAGIAIVGAAGAVFGWGTGAKRALEHVAWVDAITIYFRTSLVSLLIQLTTMAAYIVAAVGLVHSVGLINLVAATTLVMFAASIPLSLAGWGLREVSAVYALGAVGVPYSTSLVIALLIGFSSILIMAMLALVSSGFTKFAPAKTSQQIGSRASATHSDFLNWCIPIFVASAVFFQIHVPVGAGQLDVNLADSVVLFGGALFVRQMFSTSTRARSSRVPNAGIIVALMSAVIVLAFLHGWLVDGWTAWASTNRLFGWLVLLAYAATGALLAMQNGAESTRVLLRTFVAAGLAVAALELALLVAVALGADIPTNLVSYQTYRIEGFAQNPNAFGFQLLLVLAAIIALRLVGWRQRLSLTLTYMAVYFSASRAAEGTCLVVCVVAAMLGYINWRSLLVPLAYAFVGVLAIASIGHLVVFINHANHATAAINRYFDFNYNQLTKGDSAYEVNNDRWIGLVAAFKMFLAHPLFGAGLGAFVFSFEQHRGMFLIVHSTPLWLLAETGLVGFLVFAVPYVIVLHREIRGSLRSQADCARILLVLSLLAFGVMSQVHDLMYQRAFWLLIGAAVYSAIPASVRDPVPTPEAVTAGAVRIAG
ncbi:MAG TPA: glycosyltransferase [Stellaceae bacterium]|nr:glycosyltransferase [Stellaceae bacterium]